MPPPTPNSTADATVHSASQLTIGGLQSHIRRMYHDKDVARGIDGTFMWLIEEVGELASALRGDDRENLAEEFADVIAWLMTIANVAEIDLNQALQNKYGRGCPGCGQLDCQCDLSEKTMTRLLCGIFLLGWSASLAITVAAQDDSADQIGFAGRYRIGHWMPVRVDDSVATSEESSWAVLTQDGGGAEVMYRQDHPAGSTLYAIPGTEAADLRVVDGRHTVMQLQLPAAGSPGAGPSLVPPATPLGLCFGDPLGIDQIGAQRNFEPRPDHRFDHRRRSRDDSRPGDRFGSGRLPAGHRPGIGRVVPAQRFAKRRDRRLARRWRTSHRDAGQIGQHDA